jgi:hypothetical protein
LILGNGHWGNFKNYVKSFIFAAFARISWKPEVSGRLRLAAGVLFARAASEKPGRRAERGAAGGFKLGGVVCAALLPFFVVTPALSLGRSRQALREGFRPRVRGAGRLPWAAGGRRR